VLFFSDLQNNIKLIKKTSPFSPIDDLKFGNEFFVNVFGFRVVAGSKGKGFSTSDSFKEAGEGKEVGDDELLRL
jgi:hypothetical protein